MEILSEKEIDRAIEVLGRGSTIPLEGETSSDIMESFAVATIALQTYKRIPVLFEKLKNLEEQLFEDCCRYRDSKSKGMATVKACEKNGVTAARECAVETLVGYCIAPITEELPPKEEEMEP